MSELCTSTDSYYSSQLSSEHIANIQKHVYVIAIATLNKCSLRNTIQQIIFMEECEVRTMFKLLFEVFTKELDDLLVEVCSSYNLMIMDSAFIAKFLCADIIQPYYNHNWMIYDQLWISSTPLELMCCPIQVLHQIFAIRFGALVTNYPRSFLLRKLCNCSTIHDDDLFERIQDEVREIAI